MTDKQKELLEIFVERLAIVDNLGDPECDTCSGHGCVDAGNEWGCVMEHCPDCYTNEEA